MALTPEQVLNKHFQTTQFRRGYEERDVDDFLDDIVGEMRSLIEQRDDYLKQLNDCRASKNQPALRTGAAAGAAAVAGAGDEASVQDAERAFEAASERAAKARTDAESAERSAKERIERANAAAQRAEETAKSKVDKAQLDEAQARLTDLDNKAADAEARLAKAQQQTRAAESGQTGEGAAPAPGDAAGIIALAQRLHDEHVHNGEAKRDQLVSVGQQQHDDLVATGQRRHDEASQAADEMSANAVAQRDTMLAEATNQRDTMLAEATAKRDTMLTEATSKRDEILTEARERSSGMVAQAQQQKAATLEELDKQKSLLGKKIDELRGFERDYRSNLKAYITGQLKDLEHSGELTPAREGGGRQG
ncbi:MAG: DivIVA domain-containing protein [Intrasporangium sp.]|uniref:DivIVA domain-containing protein n=1 Tax=Intrasporangium sp. TaxID=1925024 RepID=UPI00264897AB|nr:DivIVA domain-containing protein [Intrasporangium sp.]MDN5796070.1 DivIVA domain-containing protein [Intrasporangium sp.]